MLLFVFNLAVDCRFGHALATKPLLFVLLVLPEGLLAQGGLPNQPYIYVEGKAEMEKSADLIYLNFRVEARNPERPKANEQVQAKAKKVFALLKDAKIPEWDIVVQDLSSEPKYESDDSDPKKRGKLIGYSVTRRLK